MIIKDKYYTQIDSLLQKTDGSFFLYDFDGLSDHLSAIAQCREPWLDIYYACKANPLTGILNLMLTHDFGIDTASMGEVRQAFAAEAPADKIINTGPAKSKAYLARLLDCGIRTIVLESINQAYWLSELASEMQVQTKALLRVQLDWEEGRSVLGGNAITPFGISVADWANLDISRLTNIELLGFHVFQWGNVIDINKLNSLWSRIAEEMQAFSSRRNIPLQVLDLGGGLGIPYHNESFRIDFTDVIRVLNIIRNDFSIPKIWMELGRYAVGEYGYYFTKVIDRKCVRGKEILVTDGGINHLARPALVNQSFPCELWRPGNAESATYQIHGPLCTSLDTQGSYDLPNDIRPGDTLVFSQAGAYGFTESMPYFLCHDLPGEFVISDGKLSVVRGIQDSTAWSK